MRLIHGALSGYTGGCRCSECKRAMSDYHRERRYSGRGPQRLEVDREALGDLLNELFPFGLTDQCPARRATAVA